MSDLTVFRRHCREMAKAKHHPDCDIVERLRAWAEDDTSAESDPPRCDGSCMPVKDRVLFTQLANEVDRYLGSARCSTDRATVAAGEDEEDA